MQVLAAKARNIRMKPRIYWDHIGAMQVDVVTATLPSFAERAAWSGSGRSLNVILNGNQERWGRAGDTPSPDSGALLEQGPVAVKDAEDETAV